MRQRNRGRKESGHRWHRAGRRLHRRAAPAARRAARLSCRDRTESTPGVDWFRGDLEKPDTLKFPPFATLYCTADAILLADALPRLFNPSLKRIVVFSSTSVITKQDTEVEAEREMIRRLADAEQQDRGGMRTAQCWLDDTAPHLDLRRGPRHQHHAVVAADSPVRIHAAGRRSTGLAATGACGGSGDRSDRRGRELPRRSTSSMRCPGAETLTYREMIGRIFDGLADAAAHDLGAPRAVAGRSSCWRSRCFPAPMSRWASA